MTDTKHDQHDGAPPGTLAARTLSALRTARTDTPPDATAPKTKTATTEPVAAEVKTEVKTATETATATKIATKTKSATRTAPIATKTDTAKTVAKTDTAKTVAKTDTAKTGATKTGTTKTGATKSIATKAKPVPSATERPVSRRVAALLIALVVAAAVFAGVAAIVWWRAGHDSARDAARERDAAALAARLDVAALNTLDYRKPGAALARWLAVSTGTVHDQFAQSAKSAASLIAQAKTSTAGTVLDAAVASLDTRSRTATVLVSINVKRIPATGAATTSRNRYLATMKFVGGQYKISDLQIVEVQLA